jgi:hypothetical protein
LYSFFNFVIFHTAIFHAILFEHFVSRHVSKINCPFVYLLYLSNLSTGVEWDFKQSSPTVRLLPTVQLHIRTLPLRLHVPLFILRINLHGSASVLLRSHTIPASRLGAVGDAGILAHRSACLTGVCTDPITSVTWNYFRAMTIRKQNYGIILLSYNHRPS